MDVDVLLPNTSQYGVLHLFTLKLSEALKRQGFSVRLLPKEVYSRTLFESPPDFTIGFNGAPRDDNGEFLCELALVPHVACLVDPPYRFLDLQTSPYIFVGCDDRACVELFKTPQHPQYYFFPHGVEPELAPDSSLLRRYDVVFLGSWMSSSLRRKRWKEMFPEIISACMEEAAEEALGNSEKHFIQIFLNLVNAKADLSNIPLSSLAQVLQDLELYLKARDREDLLRSITSCRVDFFGNTTDESRTDLFFKDKPNIALHPAVEYSEAINIMKQSKIVLNSGIKSTYGGHERIFSGLAAGAAVMTSDNPFIREYFQDEQSILTYRHKHLDLVDAKLRYFLNDEQTRYSLVEKGRSLVMQHHTWDARLNKFLPQVLPAIRSLN